MKNLNNKRFGKMFPKYFFSRKCLLKYIQANEQMSAADNKIRWFCINYNYFAKIFAKMKELGGFHENENFMMIFANMITRRNLAFLQKL